MACHERVAVAPALRRTVEGAADGARDQRRRAYAVNVGKLHLAALMAIGTFREAQSSAVHRRASTKSSTAVRCPSVSRYTSVRAPSARAAGRGIATSPAGVRIETAARGMTPMPRPL